MINWLKTIAAVITAITTIIGGWVFLDLPTPATRYYVSSSLEVPLKSINRRLLKAERRLYAAELFQWERNNPPPRSEQVELTIDRLRQEIAEIDRALAGG